MFCRNCGKEIAADARSCPSCGAVGPGAVPITNQQVYVRPEKRGMSGCAVVVLAVVLAVPVIGILAGIALPAYQDYVTRAKVGAALDAVETLKKQVEISWVQSKKMPDRLSYEEMRQASGAAIIQDVELNRANGALTLKFNDVVPGVANKSIRLVPTTTEARPLPWVCSSIDVPPKFLPVSCR